MNVASFVINSVAGRGTKVPTGNDTRALDGVCRLTQNNLSSTMRVAAKSGSAPRVGAAQNRFCTCAELNEAAKLPRAFQHPAYPDQMRSQRGVGTIFQG